MACWSPSWCARWCARCTASPSTSRSAPSSRAPDASRPIASNRTSGTMRRHGSPSTCGCAPRPWPRGSRSARFGVRHRGRRRADDAPRSRSAGRPGAGREPSCARRVLEGGERCRTTAHVGNRSDGVARRANLGLSGAGRAGPSRHRRDQAAARGGARGEPARAHRRGDLVSGAAAPTTSSG